MLVWLVRCVFVYAVDKTNCTPVSLCVNYWIGQETHFEIEYYGHFHPRNWDEEDKWVEIDRNEFLQHFNEAQRLISLAVSLK